MVCGVRCDYWKEIVPLLRVQHLSEVHILTQTARCKNCKKICRLPYRTWRSEFANRENMSRCRLRYIHGFTAENLKVWRWEAFHALHRRHGTRTLQRAARAWNIYNIVKRILSVLSYANSNNGSRKGLAAVTIYTYNIPLDIDITLELNKIIR